MQNNDEKIKQISDSTAHGRFLQHARNGQSFGDWHDEQCGVKRAPVKPQSGVDAFVMVSFDNGNVWHSAVFASLIDVKEHGRGPWSIPKATELARSIVAACSQKAPLVALQNQPILVRVLDVDIGSSNREYSMFRIISPKVVS